MSNCCQLIKSKQIRLILIALIWYHNSKMYLFFSISIKNKSVKLVTFLFPTWLWVPLLEWKMFILPECRISYKFTDGVLLSALLFFFSYVFLPLLFIIFSWTWVLIVHILINISHHLKYWQNFKWCISYINLIKHLLYMCLIQDVCYYTKRVCMKDKGGNSCIRRQNTWFE